MALEAPIYHEYGPSKRILLSECHMKITLKVVGRELFTMLRRQADELKLVYPKTGTQLEHFEWDIVEITTVRPEHLLSYPDTPSALLIDAEEPTYVEKIQLLEKKELTF